MQGITELSSTLAFSAQRDKDHPWDKKNIRIYDKVRRIKSSFEQYQSSMHFLIA